MQIDQRTYDVTLALTTRDDNRRHLRKSILTRTRTRAGEKEIGMQVRRVIVVAQMSTYNKCARLGNANKRMHFHFPPFHFTFATRNAVSRALR